MRTRRFQSSSDPVSPGHRSVLLQESIDALEIQPDDIVIDATLGGAGYAAKIVEKLGPSGTFIGFDLDADAIGRAKNMLESARCRVYLVEANFRHMDRELEKLSISEATKIVFDLGWSGYQLQAGRGFSFLTDEPLSMAYSKSGSGLTAQIIVNEWAEESLADVIFGWGEERYARRIAKAIVDARENKPIQTSLQLAEIVKAAVPPKYRFGRLHPATKTFQAIRIATNDELGSLTDGLRAAWTLLKPGGRIVVVTFHSIEDRIVKEAFRSLSREGKAVLVNRKPIAPSEEELIDNPRARSAKLRVIQKEI